MTGLTHDRQQLIQECQGLVRSLALQIKGKIPPSIDLEDLISYGQIGLAEAARDFDPDRGFRFSTFAYYRVRGAIYDGVSKMSWFNRPQCQQLRHEQMASEFLQENAMQQQAEETASPCSEDELRWFRDLSRALTVVSLIGSSASEKRSGDFEDDESKSPPSVAIDREIFQKLHELIDALPQQEGEIIRATYFEGTTLQAVGERLGLSKSWASRLHAKALRRLAQMLGSLRF